MKAVDDTIIYIGKAKSLKNRVRSYFSGTKDIKTTHLVRKINTIDYIVTATEYEALILENNLIKLHRPRYNIDLKDGKTYPVVRITREDFPRVFRTRRIVDDGSEYFGPFPGIPDLGRYLEYLLSVFPIRKCTGVLKKRKDPCLYYHMGRCLAPCAGKTTREEYGRNIEAIRRLFRGETEQLVGELTTSMHEAAHRLEFEQAGHFRDMLQTIQRLNRPQNVMDFNAQGRDYLAISASAGHAAGAVLRMRGGKLLAKDNIGLPNILENEENTAQFIMQYYQHAEELPEVLVVQDCSDAAMLERYFQERFGKDLRLVAPDNSRDEAILEMARQNSREELSKLLRSRRPDDALEELKICLSLPALPRRIEGFDISHLHGKWTVASMVSFLNALPDKSSYRRFRIRSLDGAIDDFESLREATVRRYSRLANEEKPFPDLVLIDGGIGQVNAVHEILTALGITGLPIVGLAKENEELFLPGVSAPIILSRSSNALRILQAVRDEAHRFATSYNARLREQSTSFTAFSGIKGIGPAKTKKLLDRFGSFESISRVNPKELAEAVGLSLEAAERVIAYTGKLKPGDGSASQGH